MTVAVPIFFFIVGVVLGSFYNVVIYRVPLDISIAKGRSFCPTCKQKLHAIDLIPIISQLLLRSRCRYCKEKISWRYPMIELITGLLFLLAYYQNEFAYGELVALTPECGLLIVFWSVLLICMMIDIDHQVICDWVLAAGVPFIVAFQFIPNVDVWAHVFSLLIGFGFFLVIYLLARLIYKQEAFGFGDVLLAGFVGAFLGHWVYAVLACFLSFIVGVIHVIVIKLRKNEINGKTEIPFGPSICIAAFLVSLWGEPMASFLNLSYFM